RSSGSGRSAPPRESPAPGSPRQPAPAGAFAGSSDSSRSRHAVLVGAQRKRHVMRADDTALRRTSSTNPILTLSQRHYVKKLGGCPLPRELPLHPRHDRVADLVLWHAGGAAHVVALRIDARLLGRAVLHQEVDVVDRRLVVELAVDAEDRRRG